MLVLVIPGPSFRIAELIVRDKGHLCDLFEIRCDLFRDFSLAALSSFCATLPRPYILTLRSTTDCGGFQAREEQREALLLKLASLHPPYIDLESHLSEATIAAVRLESPKSKIILSYHAFQTFPEDLEQLYREMQRIPADLYKIAVIVRNSWEALQLLLFANSYSAKPIVIGMGEDGIFTRILPPILGLPLTYAAPSESNSVAPGQLSINELLDRYRYRSLSPKSKIFGLIGGMVQDSRSPLIHNELFQQLHIDGVYLKIRVEERYFSLFLQAARELGFYGLSVTMPLKESVVAHLDGIDGRGKQSGAVNTLLWRDGKLYGANTDGIGALTTINNHLPVKGCSILLLGAGGAARAIVAAALTKGASVAVFNRGAKRLFSLVAFFDGAVMPLLQLTPEIVVQYDVIINCTPSELPIDPKLIPTNTWLMDIKTRPLMTTFLIAGREKGCSTISGDEMFIEQAIGQYQLWFKGLYDRQELRKALSLLCHQWLG